MKSQALPMRTIVIVILAILVMAAIVIWYLTYSGKISDSTWDFLNFSEKKAEDTFDCTGGKPCPPGYQCCASNMLCVPVTESCPP